MPHVRNGKGHGLVGVVPKLDRGGVVPSHHDAAAEGAEAREMLQGMLQGDALSLQLRAL